MIYNILLGINIFIIYKLLQKIDNELMYIYNTLITIYKVPKFERPEKFGTCIGALLFIIFYVFLLLWMSTSFFKLIKVIL